MNFTHILSFFGIIQGVVLAFFLFTSKGRFKNANWFLASALMIIAFSYSIFISKLYYFHADILSLKITLHLTSLFCGPFIFQYVSSFLDNGKINFRSTKQTLLPLLGIYILSIIYFLITRLLLKNLDFTGIDSIIDKSTSVLMFTIMFYFIFYASLKLRIACTVSENQNFCNTDIRLKWIKWLVRGLLILLLGFLFSEVVYYKFSVIEYIWLLASVLIYTMGYITIRIPALFHTETSNIFQTENSKKYERSSLTEEISSQLYERIIEVMKQDKPFMQNNITLTELAKRISTSNHHLSQIINEKFRMNFFDFINQYRVSEAQALFEDKKQSNIKISEIGFMVGFNSISTFNNAFKKHTGKTPSEYRNLQNVN